MEPEYQGAISAMGRATLGAFRSTPLGIVVAESKPTPARAPLVRDMFGDERATGKILTFLGDTKVGYAARMAAPEEEEGRQRGRRQEGRRTSLARHRLSISLSIVDIPFVILFVSILFWGEGSG